MRKAVKAGRPKCLSTTSCAGHHSSSVFVFHCLSSHPPRRRAEDRATVLLKAEPGDQEQHASGTVHDTQPPCFPAVTQGVIQSTLQGTCCQTAQCHSAVSQKAHVAKLHSSVLLLPSPIQTPTDILRMRAETDVKAVMFLNRCTMEVPKEKEATHSFLPSPLMGSFQGQSLIPGQQAMSSSRGGCWELKCHCLQFAPTLSK